MVLESEVDGSGKNVNKDPLSFWKTHFREGDGTQQHPFEVKSGVPIGEVLKDMAYLTQSAPGKIIYAMFNNSVITLNNGLEVTASGPNEQNILPLAKNSIKDLINKKHLDEAVQPISLQDFTTLNHSTSFLGRLKARVVGTPPKSTNHK